MMIVPLRASSLPAVMRRSQAAQRVAILRGVRAGARLGRRALMKATPKDQGGARKAWRVVEGAGGVVSLRNDSPIIGILEKGARPHPVSPEGRQAIYEWVLRRFRLVGTAREGYAAVHSSELFPGQRGRRTFRAVKGGDDVAKAITWGICEKIRTKGQAPRYFVRDTLPALTRLVCTEVERALGKVGGRRR